MLLKGAQWLGLKERRQKDLAMMTLMIQQRKWSSAQIVIHHDGRKPSKKAENGRSSSCGDTELCVVTEPLFVDFKQPHGNDGCGKRATER